MRATDCHCGHHFEAQDDDELFRLCRSIDALRIAADESVAA
jgi:hypothetical protein